MQGMMAGLSTVDCWQHLLCGLDVFALARLLKLVETSRASRFYWKTIYEGYIHCLVLQEPILAVAQPPLALARHHRELAAQTQQASGSDPSIRPTGHNPTAMSNTTTEALPLDPSAARAQQEAAAAAAALAARAAYEADQALLRRVRMELRAICVAALADKRWRDFAMPVDPEVCMGCKRACKPWAHT